MANMHAVTFLGLPTYQGKIQVSKEARKKFKRKIRKLTRRNNPLSMYRVIQELNVYLCGWVIYFRVQEFKSLKKIFLSKDGRENFYHKSWRNKV